MIWYLIWAMFLILVHLLHCKGQSLTMYVPERGNPHLCIVVLYVREGSEREQCHLLGSPPPFSYFPCFSQVNWALSCAAVAQIHRLLGWCMFLGSMGPSSRLSCEAGSFLPLPPQPPQVFSVRGFEALFPCAGTLGCVVCLAPQLFLPAYPHTNVGPPVLPAAASHTHHLAGCPLHPSCASPLLPQVWVNVPSLTLWLSDFHTVQFSGRSGCFFLFKLVVILPLVGQGSEAYLPTPPSCPEVQNIIFYLIYVSFPQ